MHRRQGLAALIALISVFAVAACSGGNEVADLTTVAPASSSTRPAATTTAPPITEPTVVATTDPAITVPDTTDGPPATTVADDGLTGPTFSDALGVKVDGAPGVATRGDTRQLLPEGLYVHIAWEPDPQDPSVFTVQPDDVEILEAYANASLAYYRAVTTTLTTDDPAFALYMTDSGEQYDGNFDKARAGGFTGSLGSGVVLRPYVLADQRTGTEATVLDCYLQNEQFVALGKDPLLAPLAPKGTIASMVLTGEGWKVDVIAAEFKACL
jgi:hypothetical protein